MSYLELLFIGIGLAMDAFAVSICKGLGMKRVNKLHCFIIALFFGGFQAVMPFAGWLLGKQFQSYIESVDHWIAFALLVCLGAKAVLEAVRDHDDGCAEKQESVLNVKELFLLAIATSIDALAVGVTFAFLQVSILPAASIIGLVTFVICIFGVFIGNLFGSRFQKKAEIAGGAILIIIGLKILLEHLHIFQ
ncbi:putative sporulation protein YtaF [uncultured Roseburia sp.]|uniref:Putative manganese efflux pump MntP n=1 Tax=Brotonthovivens ammoniilytica TaxID=2981725 RepID=A0ABT2TQ81_9FIRM|nr:manganese efflux pump MntP family protein [Brotonthovivens ammoniilytica]MCU6763772.1 manganese efflux pump MntP family protein [Brotonthovivens ammoniilytica]SCJ34469.1 putative sporulation protein YtaF [uncultured Roseburia sp.]